MHVAESVKRFCDDDMHKNKQLKYVVWNRDPHDVL